MVPASNQKVLTSGVALLVLGKDYQFRTEFRLSGDRLVIVGGGDPAFGDPVLLEKSKAKLTVPQLLADEERGDSYRRLMRWAIGNRDAAVALQDSLRAQVQQMTVALAQAETNLAYSYIRAPFAGYIAERNLDPGAYVSGTTASTSTVSRGILSVHDVETVRTLIEVVEKDVPLVQVGQRADVRAEAYPNEVFEGRVTRIVQALNRATRTMTVEVDLPNKDHRLKGGMFARVEVLVGKHPQAIQIPLDAVSRLEESQYVYVVKDGKAHQVPVELGARAENRVEVVKGLAGDEQLIVSGKDLVSEGVPVQVQPLGDAKQESSKQS